MSVPISFPSTTPNFQLPLLFAGQAQKEFFFNQAISLVDALGSNCVVSSAHTPPAAPIDGECYRVSAPGENDWFGHDDEIAVRIGGTWHFVTPYVGMAVFDRAADTLIHYKAGWNAAVEPLAPSGGTTVDLEARAALSELIEALRNLGVFANP